MHSHEPLVGPCSGDIEVVCMPVFHAVGQLIVLTHYLCAGVHMVIVPLGPLPLFFDVG